MSSDTSTEHSFIVYMLAPTPSLHHFTTPIALKLLEDNFSLDRWSYALQVS